MGDKNMAEKYMPKEGQLRKDVLIERLDRIIELLEAILKIQAIEATE